MTQEQIVELVQRRPWTMIIAALILVAVVTAIGSGIETYIYPVLKRWGL